MSNNNFDHWCGTSFKKGDLVEIKTPAVLDRGTFTINTGVVVDYWPSNVYEKATYEVLVNGEVVHVDPRRISSL